MSKERVTLDMNVNEMFYALSEGNPGASMVLMSLFGNGEGLMDVLMCDSRRLYGERIYRLYNEVCNGDIERLRYHICVELPNQETGQLAVTGPFSPDCRFGFDSPESKKFWESRKFGKPGSFWALKNPPGCGYAYPLGYDGSEPSATEAE